MFLLDEIDKMSMDFRGDPASALLEVLDPEQNNTFNDHYLDLDYDLSDMMFITTANQQHAIPLPLQDRLEIIELPGYTEWEKLAIAKQYLIPKQAEANGVKDLDVTWHDDALIAIIHRYTKEAGVRNLEREIATVCRKIAKEWLAQRAHRERRSRSRPTSCRPGSASSSYREARREKEDEIGLANGLAVTMFGGDLLTAEVTIVPGKGKLTLTGKLGDVMQESAQAAMSYLRSRAGTLRAVERLPEQDRRPRPLPRGRDPQGRAARRASPWRPRWRRAPAHPGAADDRDDRRGHAARPRAADRRPQGEDPRRRTARASTTVLIPDENRKDMKDVPRRCSSSSRSIPVKHMDEVLRHALAHPQPDEFLREPSSVVDWRIVETMPPADPREAH